MQHRNLLSLAAILGMLAVIFGAFGAHALKASLDPVSLGNWETATRYQFYHVFGMIVAVLLAERSGDKYGLRAAWWFLAGIVLFCGSLYLLSLRSLFSVNLNWLGPITPLGGLCFISGWVWIFIVVRRSLKK